MFKEFDIGTLDNLKHPSCIRVQPQKAPNPFLSGQLSVVVYRKQGARERECVHITATPPNKSTVGHSKLKGGQKHLFTSKSRMILFNIIVTTFLTKSEIWLIDIGERENGLKMKDMLLESELKSRCFLSSLLSKP